jgi:hypothetical protein
VRRAFKAQAVVQEALDHLARQAQLALSALQAQQALRVPVVSRVRLALWVLSVLLVRQVLLGHQVFKVRAAALASLALVVCKAQAVPLV